MEKKITLTSEQLLGASSRALYRLTQTVDKFGKEKGLSPEFISEKKKEATIVGGLALSELAAVLFEEEGKE